MEWNAYTLAHSISLCVESRKRDLCVVPFFPLTLKPFIDCRPQHSAFIFDRPSHFNAFHSFFVCSIQFFDCLKDFHWMRNNFIDLCTRELHKHIYMKHLLALRFNIYSQHTHKCMHLFTWYEISQSDFCQYQKRTTLCVQHRYTHTFFFCGICSRYYYCHYYYYCHHFFPWERDACGIGCKNIFVYVYVCVCMWVNLPQKLDYINIKVLCGISARKHVAC